MLLNTINSDQNEESWPDIISDYSKHKANFSSVDGVVTYKGRAVVLSS